MRHQVWQLATSYPDCCYQLARLLCDPVYHGNGIPRGRGEPVLLIPGFLAGDWTLRVMAGWLSRIGYRPYLSGITCNVRAPNQTGELLARRLPYLVKETGSPVIIVGHSLGGMLARFLGAHFPELVRHVVALGSPIRNFPQVAHPFVGLAFLASQVLRKEVMGEASPDLLGFIQSVSSPIPQEVGFTAIFSKQDEIVDWRACLDPQGDNREVSGRHVGLIVNTEVYHMLAGVLATCSQGKEVRPTRRVFLFLSYLASRFFSFNPTRKIGLPPRLR